MKARRSLVFRERKRFELRQEAKASRTLREYGFCEADMWSKEEADVAQELLRGLSVVAREQKERLPGQGRHLDPDSYLWERQEPDYVGILAREVARVAGNSVDQQRLCKHVAARLLDRIRVRVAKGEECAVAARLLDGVDVAAVAREESLLPCVLARAEELDEDSVGMSREHHESRCASWLGVWLSA